MRDITVTEAAAEAIIETANSKRCDLIVMSSNVSARSNRTCLQ
jgi:hypothetical protein